MKIIEDILKRQQEQQCKLSEVKIYAAEQAELQRLWENFDSPRMVLKKEPHEEDSLPPWVMYIALYIRR